MYPSHVFISQNIFWGFERVSTCNFTRDYYFKYTALSTSCDALSKKVFNNGKNILCLCFSDCGNDLDFCKRYDAVVRKKMEPDRKAAGEIRSLGDRFSFKGLINCTLFLECHGSGVINSFWLPEYCRPLYLAHIVPPWNYSHNSSSKNMPSFYASCVLNS